MQVRKDASLQLLVDLMGESNCRGRGKMVYGLGAWRRVEWGVRYRPEHDVRRLSRPSLFPCCCPSLVLSVAYAAVKFVFN